jgi:hypothetical protein
MRGENTMALFQKAPDLIRDRDAAKANAERLAAKLAKAVAAVTVTKSNTQRAALDGDDAALDLAETAERAALHHLATMRTACEAADKLLTLLESQLASVADEKLRSVTNSSTIALADELIEAGNAYCASTALLNEVCTRALAVTMEANGLCVYTASSMIEVKVATEVVAEEIRQHGRAVLNKLAKAEMPVPAPPPAKVAPKVPEQLTRVFATRAVRWRDADGSERCSGKFLDIDISAAQAERALASGAALPLDHPERKRNLGSWPGHVSINNCYDLDAAPDAVPQHDPVIHSAFQPIDRGPPFKLKIAGSGS